MIRSGATDDELAAAIATSWSVREDRYSELRSAGDGRPGTDRDVLHRRLEFPCGSNGRISRAASFAAWVGGSGRQLLIWFGFAVLYQLARGVADRNSAKAFANGYHVVRIETRVGCIACTS